MVSSFTVTVEQLSGHISKSKSQWPRRLTVKKVVIHQILSERKSSCVFMVKNSCQWAFGYIPNVVWFLLWREKWIPCTGLMLQNNTFNCFYVKYLCILSVSLQGNGPVGLDGTSVAVCVTPQTLQRCKETLWRKLALGWWIKAQTQSKPSLYSGDISD